MANMEKYIHKVHYYETDKMGITHHSNYIRWMEEARVDFLRQIGWDFDRLEELGIVSPVIGVDCKYKLSTRFADDVAIIVTVEEFKGVKLRLRYVMENADGKLVCEGHSEHGFLHENGMPIRLAKEFPEFYKVLTELVAE